jgi:hypothetical protein
MFVILNLLSIRLILKSETQTEPAVSIKRAKAVFVIIIAK